MRSDMNTPEVQAERCVHSYMERASCRACVDCCPQRAWVLDEDQLGIDEQRCDGCDLCAAACPEQAIQPRFSLRVQKTHRGTFAFAACVQAGISGRDTPRIPCLHGISLFNLLSLVQQGLEELVVARGDCDQCPRGGGQRLADRVQSLNRLLQARGKSPIAYLTLGAGAWKQHWEQVQTWVRQRPMSRRHFFRNTLIQAKQPLETVLAAPAASREPERFLLKAKRGDLVLAAPQIDPQRCQGCDACANLCPHDAIRLIHRDAYEIQADACTGCGICADVCEAKALELVRWEPLVQTQVSLNRYRCTACGVPYHLPAERRDADLCPICRQHNPYRQLFQVLEG